MLQLSNTTPFKATLLPLPDTAGLDSVFAVVKGTFSVGPRAVVTENQVPIQLADQYAGAPAQSGLVAASDAALVKPGTDILVRGHAYAPGGRITPRTSV